MPFEMNFDTQLPVAEPACIHLRSKAMYVSGELRNVGPEDGGSQHCWCNLTQHVIGPDQSQVDRRSCTNGRDCYKDTY